MSEFLRRDPNARVACETLLADQYVVVAGDFRVHNPAVVGEVRDLTPAIVRPVLTDTGYRSAETGVDPVYCHIDVRFNGQSANINQGVEREDGVLGAGDQGLMFGYACDETPELMPAAIQYAHRLVQRQAELRQGGQLPWLQPDAKSQMTLR